MATLLKTTREYVDLDFSFARHPVSNNVSLKKTVNAVKQSIRHLMMLRSGDKPFHPEIKSPIYDYLFDNMSSITQVVLESETRKYLEVYEPRVTLTQVRVSFPDANSINCDIAGVIINLSTPFTVNILVNRLR
jgi:uncharacterized protein